MPPPTNVTRPSYDDARWNPDLHAQLRRTPATEGAATRKALNSLVRRYMYQILTGCGRERCETPMCATARKGKRKFSHISAKLLASELTCSSTSYLCPGLPADADFGPVDDVQPELSTKSLIHRIYQTSSLATVGLSKDPTPSEQPELLTFDCIYADIVEHLSRTTTTTGDPTLMHDTFIAVFSSAERLAKSFGSWTPRMGYLLDLDLSEVLGAWYCIEQGGAGLKRGVIGALTRVLTTPFPSTMSAKERAKVLVIALYTVTAHQDPCVVDADPYYAIPAIRALLNIDPPEEVKQYFAKRTKEEDITRGLELLCKTITERVSQDWETVRGIGEEGCWGGIKWLEMMYEADKQRMEPMAKEEWFHLPEKILKESSYLETIKPWLESTDKSPKNILNYPFLLSFSTRVSLLRASSFGSMLALEQSIGVNAAVVAQLSRHFTRALTPRSSESCHILDIRRTHLVHDAFAGISGRKTWELKRPLRVRFVGGGEDGVDQGGLQKEFFASLCHVVFDEDYGLFVTDADSQLVWFNPAARDEVRTYELVGMLVGMAVYNGVILPLSFPKMMYKKILGEEISLTDFAEWCPGVMRGMLTMLEWEDGDVEEVFSLSYDYSWKHWDGSVNTVCMKEGHEPGTIPVTNANRADYAYDYLAYTVHKSIERQWEAFSRGLAVCTNARMFTLFSPTELQSVFQGEQDLNIDEWRAITQYTDGYSPTHRTIRAFWSIVSALPPRLQRQLLVFVTASDRLPPGGMGKLTFVIQRNGPDSDRLPSAQTCFCRLLLPEYEGRRKLKKMLMTAVEFGQEGFGLV
ncbi:hypothetical protein SAICODRAFT_93532 [Saitoella complicata NRRL Y-17804]|uniref:HECT-type E3 ubiquitin transferase n=1 Tax=Saitoella complicata (strain BCRC 22490 / CBS 7301 / JCM 7358 / NBRC 10748 / NRRL Y-17804) TaxID=698492 RepID=A0A0E9NCV1_SAICN|nr:uncharacterized protein SAICODRAFT_93532 [Saitoella complicata NRRL Y-17804]ODQ52579.1 hypothetical protein SAICODRAFT_93532 [Saitoella complicata NRRL Y-17804]GAO47526.1 hypothetical protein G7K_1731-t1 [Saitoella complicata NRRL Y-17804]